VTIIRFYWIATKSFYDYPKLKINKMENKGNGSTIIDFIEKNFELIKKVELYSGVINKRSSNL
jgi:hypothetical protein